MRVRLALLSMLALAAAGCGPGQVTTPTPKRVVGTLPQGPSGADAGKSLFAANGCGGCHTFKPAGTNGKVGPDLDNLAEDAKKAGEGDVAAYTRASIENPDAYVVPGFAAGVMPPYQGKLTESQIGDLVAFLTQQS